MFKTAHQLVQEAKARITESNAAGVIERLQTASSLLLDVREPEEYNAGHLAGAINIPRGMLEFRISADPAMQDLTRPIIVYCKTSGRAALAALSLESMGFANVVSLAGGYDGWVEAGQPVTKPDSLSFE